MECVLATLNEEKCREMMAVLGDCPVFWRRQSGFSLSAVDETGQTFVENALFKARHAALHTGLPALADDSGLEIDLLQGEPGIFSERYAGAHASAQDRMNLVLEKLRAFRSQYPLPKARFHAVIVFIMHPKDSAPFLFHGCWQGNILPEACGAGGFGYDPIFYVPTHDCSAAQLTESVKAHISHRGQALRAFMSHWNSVAARWQCLRELQ